ncbi:polysaccharide deacetylase [Oerskovia flava]|uniref:polysaccharide deacetylase n=1 Tax=Oerskovia flava TaxID=2986422 RepID=UPI00223F5FE9|nr:polysaccharide deacetylase [Oerskovia sp. JB1-3-2]
MVPSEGTPLSARSRSIVASVLTVVVLLLTATCAVRLGVDVVTAARPPGKAAPPAPVVPEVPVRAETNVPMVALEPGEEPPQFVIFSFDGAGWHDRWQEFMTAAEQVDARFTGFLTGIYLLTDERRDEYTGPGHSTGRASIGFGGDEEDVLRLVEDLNQAYAAGHELGTHYNGHFCSDNPPGGNQWSTADWDDELDQFFRFLRRWDTLNEIPDAPALAFGPDDVKGGRTPCLEGVWEELAPAWEAHGLTYDSSKPGHGMAWPQVEEGVWQFPVPSTRSPAFGTVLAMDYNFWFKYNGARDAPDEADEIRAGVLETYRHMHTTASEGNRAPIVVANHFNRWSGNAFNPAALDFMLEVCGEPDTVCATYQDVIAWMELQDPEVLAELQSREPVL